MLPGRYTLPTCVLVWAAYAQAAPTPTLTAVRAHGLACGVVTEAQDWNKEDVHGDLSPLGAEICRALAVAVLGRADNVAIHAYPGEPEALHALQTGEVDAVAGVTPGITRAAQYGVIFGPAIFWDTQTFLVHHASGVTDASGLAGGTVCAIDGTEAESVMLAAMRARGIAVKPFPFQEEGEMDAALVGGHCRAITEYASRLAEVRAQFRSVHDFELLPDVLAVSPASIATRAGDAAWSAIANATIDALVEAEMQGITRRNVAALRQMDDPVKKHLLGMDWSAGQSLGLAHDWSARMLAAVGNYGEIFARTVGYDSPLGLKRGLNAVCLHGGAICASQIR